MLSTVPSILPQPFNAGLPLCCRHLNVDTRIPQPVTPGPQGGSPRRRPGSGPHAAQRAGVSASLGALSRCAAHPQSQPARRPLTPVRMMLRHCTAAASHQQCEQGTCWHLLELLWEGVVVDAKALEEQLVLEPGLGALQAQPAFQTLLRAPAWSAGASNRLHTFSVCCASAPVQPSCTSAQ